MLWVIKYVLLVGFKKMQLFKFTHLSKHLLDCQAMQALHCEIEPSYGNLYSHDLESLVRSLIPS